MGSPSELTSGYTRAEFFLFAVRLLFEEMAAEKKGATAC